ncbi:MAG: hypothetical protein KBS93_04185 [Flavobacteriaceae bacterium]|nr:hypothetical protein [Candidatus Onthonaster equi]
MKKLLFTALLSLFTFNFATAQAYSGNGDQKVSLGFVPWGYGTGLTAIYDYGLSDLISIGGGGEFYFSGKNEDKDNFYIFGRANVHLGELLNMPSNMDLYPGLDVGFNHGLGLGAHLGFRYLFSDNIGAYIEAGSRGSLGLLIQL